MAESLPKRIPFRPLHHTVRDLVESEYRLIHDERFQYECDDINIDEASRAMPSRFAEFSSIASPVASVREVNLDRISLKIYEPPKSSSLATLSAGLLFAHGGGWVAGRKDSEAHILSRVCHDTGCIAVSVGYRLAPEHQYPGPVDDCFEALEYVWKNAEELKINRNLIFTAGLSAGGNLATAITLKASLADPLITVRALIAIAAPCDNTATPESETWKQNMHAPVVPPRKAQKYQEYYVGRQDSLSWRGNEWAASPLLAPLDVLGRCPETLLLVPRLDTYYAENIEFEKRLREAGVAVKLIVYPGAVHSFMSMDRILPSGRRGIEDMANFMKEKIDEYFQGSSKIHPNDLKDERDFRLLKEQAAMASELTSSLSTKH